MKMSAIHLLYISFRRFKEAQSLCEIFPKGKSIRVVVTVYYSAMKKVMMSMSAIQRRTEIRGQATGGESDMWIARKIHRGCDLIIPVSLC
jgi:hypothetical protein